MATMAKVCRHLPKKTLSRNNFVLNPYFRAQPQKLIRHGKPDYPSTYNNNVICQKIIPRLEHSTF